MTFLGEEFFGIKSLNIGEKFITLSAIVTFFGEDFFGMDSPSINEPIIPGFAIRLKFASSLDKERWFYPV